PDRFEAMQNRDAAVETSGALRTLAVGLMKIANDLRLLASGSRTGLNEIELPATQPGSSIMPGKVNPVIPEAVNQVAALVIGHDATIAVAGMNGNLDLNVMMPVIAHALLEQIAVTAAAARVFGTPGCLVVLGNPLGVRQRERPLEETTVEGEGRDKVLLVDISSVITDLPTRHAFGLIEEESTVGRVQSELKKAAKDERVKALVLRINSPGGGVTASDEVYGELVGFKREHKVPVVAALGDLAASGGYYVACAADQVVAHPTTVTGSIGVILVNLNLEGLLGKIGVRNETFKAGEHKDLLSPLRGATPEERRIVQS